MKNKVRALSVFALAMINLAAIGSVKNWPLTAEYGFSSIFYMIAAALVFFLPLSLVSAELATGWPKAGGVFVWVKEAFGHRTGFLAIWLLWFENVIWYPTILSYIAANVAYIISPDLASNTIYTLCVVLIAYWGATWANLRGMRASSHISSFGVLFGTFIPGLLIIVLGLIWYFSGNPLQITFSADALIPKISSIDQLVFFSGIILTFCGMEMSAIHAKDVQNPSRDYPRAILLSAVIIIGMGILGVLSIASVIPQNEISLVAGTLQAFSRFVGAYGLDSFTPYIAALFAIGAFGSMSTWIVGPTKGLLAAAQSGDLPPYFRAINKRGMPKRLMLLQAGIVSLISLVFVFMPTVSSAFWILTAIVVQLYVIMYLLLFAAAIKLKYKKPDVPRAYKVPGGKVGMWIVAGTGIASSILSLIVGFFPPAYIETGSLLFYEGVLIFCVILACLAPSLILKFQKPSWKHPLKHEVSE
ncbi:MAG: amino acid permease [Verrucomicrobia bacterium]|nr:amino acid permease [Verrucomicrobiota bacterium]